jgi:hypothetical protein
MYGMNGRRHREVWEETWEGIQKGMLGKRIEEAQFE